MSKPINVLAFDFGIKRIGVAYGQSLSKSATALEAIKADNGIPNWQTLDTLINEWQTQHAVVGLPLNMDGTEGDLCKRARKFGNRLHGRYGIPITMQDERLTTREAKSIAREQGHKGHSYNKDPVDAIAAELILTDFWHSLNA